MSVQNLSILPKVAKLSPRVLRILGCNPGPMTLQGTNTYIVGKGKDRLLIDTGDGTKPEYFLNLKKSLNFDRFGLSGIILTHWHPDHVGGVEEALRSCHRGSKVYKYPRQNEDEIPLPGGVEFVPIEDQQVFEVEGATLTAIYTPGHTTDHVVLHLKEENAIFSGDCILGEGTAVFEDLHDYMLSLNKILQLDPKIIYPGHGQFIKDPKEKIEYYIQHRNEREKQILQCLQENGGPMEPMEIVKKIYLETPESLYVAAEKNVTHHLSKLCKEGKVKRTHGDSYSS